MPVEVASDPLFGPMKQMNKMMEQMQKGFYGFFQSEAWAPAVNLYETANSYLVCVDLSGVVKEEIDLQVHEARLTLRGRRAVPVKPAALTSASDKSAEIPAAITVVPAPHPNSRKGSKADPAPQNSINGTPPRYKVHLMEIDHGQFVREVDLPQNVSQDRIHATYHNGLLWVELPKE